MGAAAEQHCSYDLSLTIFIWTNFSCPQLILVHAKPGVVHLWSAPSLGHHLLSNWTGSRTINLKTVITSLGSSSLCPVSGIVYIRNQDALIVSVSEGSIHVIHGLSDNPSYFPPDHSGPLTNENLSATLRAHFIRAEAKEMQKTDVNRIGGLTSYDGYSTMIWVHECASKWPHWVL